MLGLAGVKAIDTGKSATTVSVVFPEIAPLVAVMVEVPPATAVAKPVEFMVATEFVPEVHVAVEVRFCVEPSE